jgi:hypothetical protein
MTQNPLLYEKSMNNLPVYFIRHKFSEKICKELKEKQVVAYHYLDEYHEALSDYSEQSRGLTQAFNAFHAMSVRGAIVVSEYENSNEFTVGQLEPTVKLGELNIDCSVFKTLRFTGIKTFSYCKFPLLAAIRPRCSTACCVGRPFTQLIKNIYLGEPLEVATDFMHPSSIELMCEAFLRSDLVPEEIRLKYTLLRTGKTMPAVDIYGRTTTNRKIFAQVTYASENPNKTKALIDFAKGSGITVLFSKDRKLIASGLDYHFCIDDVLNQFLDSKNPVWTTMLREMVGMEAA